MEWDGREGDSVGMESTGIIAVLVVITIGLWFLWILQTLRE
jgi:hypothetical protein